MVQAAKLIVHDFILTEREFNGLVEGPDVARMTVDDDGYSVGDYCHFRHYKDDEVKWLAGRTIVDIDREGKNEKKALEPGTCIIVIN